LTTITFLGERQDIFDPEAAVLVAGQTECQNVLVPDSSGRQVWPLRRAWSGRDRNLPSDVKKP
jgi:hypothetical protein